MDESTSSVNSACCDNSDSKDEIKSACEAQSNFCTVLSLLKHKKHELEFGPDQYVNVLNYFASLIDGMPSNSKETLKFDTDNYANKLLSLIYFNGRLMLYKTKLVS